jgi:sugar O-acyltransferase (sialic acid O-acetyltransferase NeuD family)
VRKLVIFGAGDIATLAHSYFEHDSEYEVVAFTVDAAYRRGEQHQSLPVVPFESLAARYSPSEHDVFVAVSYTRMNRLRAMKCMEARRLGYHLASYTSSRAEILTDAPVGDNCFILEHALVQPFVRIGHDVTIWSGAHIGHHSVIEDHCFIAPRAAISGNVTVREHCFVGINATIRNSVTLGRSTLVGAGAVILNDTEEASVYIAPRAELLHKTSAEIDP